MSLRRGGIRFAIFALVGCALAGAAPSLAPAQGMAALPDSLITWRYQVRPVFEANSAAQVTYNELGSKFTTNVIGANGLTISSLLSVKEKNYRLQDRNEKDKMFTNSISRVFGGGLRVGVTQNDSRRLSRAALVTGGFQDFILNNQSFTGDASYLSPAQHPLRWDASGSVTLQKNEFAFKQDAGQGGSVNGGVRYRVLDGRVRVKVRGAYSDLSETSTTILEKYDGLGTTSDSLQTLVDVQVADSLDLALDWTDYSYERTFADQSRGSVGAQQLGAENLFRETERRDFRRYGVGVTSTPFNNLTIKTNALHSEQISDFVNTPTRYNRTVTDELRGDLDYRLGSGLTTRLRLENSETLRDLGAQSVSSFTDKRRRASLALSKAFSQTFSMDVTVAQGIAQSFYVNYAENPRDRDQVDSSIKANINSRPFEKISTSMFLSVTSTEIVAIHESNSGDNRTRLRYDFKPSITYTLSPRVKVEQRYGLAIEFTDYDYVLPGKDDFIDRNVTFSNRITHNVTKRVTTVFVYELTLHDRGSFLPEDPADINNPSAARFLDIDREDRTDRTTTSFTYQINRSLRLVAQYDYSRRRDTTIGSPNDRISANGGIEGGVQGTYKWGNRADLNFMLKRAEKFSPFITEDQEKYWEANMTFKYNFS